MWPSSALGGSADLGVQELGDDLECRRDGRCVPLGQVSPDTSGGGHLRDPRVDQLHVLIFQLPHGDHNHVQVAEPLLREHLRHDLPLGILRSATQVVAIREADKPLGGTSRRAEQLQALRYSVEEASAASGLGLHPIEPRLELLAPVSGHLCGRDDDFDPAAEANHGGGVAGAHLVFQDATNTSGTSTEPRQRRAGVSRQH
mmetsp:Transcript_45009/g.126802  ORF Transcript_45009/g.126802 Transcript_45009/m.126802 type:complete len:201 (+) Transcript_45009:84-686(+)